MSIASFEFSSFIELFQFSASTLLITQKKAYRLTIYHCTILVLWRENVCLSGMFFCVKKLLIISLYKMTALAFQGKWQILI